LPVQERATPDRARAFWDNAIDLVTDKDWLFLVRKTEDAFLLEAIFGEEIKPLTLEKWAVVLREAGTN
jgi:hypothetical protein